ncbi:MAG: radical SAM protein [Endomicrobiaceae bacterium]|nr:radical SAM protein [Endomicrobiaceae bacterium]
MVKKKHIEAMDVLLTMKQSEKNAEYFDIHKLINDLNKQIKHKCWELNADGRYDKTIEIVDKYSSYIDCVEILEDLCNFIANSMQEYNYNNKYDEAINLYNKYHHRFLNNVFLSNKLLNEYELASHKIILESKPRNVMLILTNSCDLNCIMCYQNKEVEKNIDKKLVDIVLNNLQYLEKIVWQGGEVLILPYFKDILLKTLQFPRIHQVITSNFQNVSQDIIELISKNNIQLTISIDGAVKKTYENIRMGASFDKLKENLKKLNKYIVEYKSKMTLQINFLIMKNNYKEISDIVDFAYKYKFSIVVFLRCVTDNENLKITKEYEKDIEVYIKQATEKAEKYNIKIINVFSEFNDVVCSEKEREDVCENKEIVNNEGLSCHLPWYEMTIQEDNAIKPHCTCGYTRITDTDKHNNIYDVWNGKIMQEYRIHILKSDEKKCIDKCRLMSLDFRKKFNR